MLRFMLTRTVLPKGRLISHVLSIWVGKMLRRFCILILDVMSSFFFFQAEDGIRDSSVTGVQTCALPILDSTGEPRAVFDGDGAQRFQERKAVPASGRQDGRAAQPGELDGNRSDPAGSEIGRASCRERV